MGGQKLAYSLFVLAVVFRAGLFSFFSAKLGPVWPKSASDRAKAGRSPPGVETPHTGPHEAEKPGAFPKGKDGYFVPAGFSWNKPWLVLPQRGLLGATRGLVGFVGRLNVGGFPKCRKERKGRTIPLEGIGQDLRHLMGIFSRVQEGNVQGCTFELLHNM